ncbi:MAG: rhodoquinone biosynthesis methyltransferase RquA [Rhodanobacteraceae bacterium]|nr:rhodoquinone biosynthesis methyltransferase RquA [Rhodanobacteraceae bacterium]
MEIKPASTSAVAEVPEYLKQTYWWAYVHPRAVYVFERQWLVNLILWGNFARLRDEALDALGQQLDGRTLQIACVYGNLSARLRERLAPEGKLDVVDILPVQLDNLARKLPVDPRIALHQGDSSALPMASGSYDRALLFFLLHEQPEDVRRKTLAEALRVLKPGGTLVIVDYHRPSAFSPLYWPMQGILRTLEPYAMDLWRQPIDEFLPKDVAITSIERSTSFAGLYHLLKIRV